MRNRHGGAAEVEGGAIGLIEVVDEDVGPSRMIDRKLTLDGRLRIWVSGLSGATLDQHRPCNPKMMCILIDET